MAINLPQRKLVSQNDQSMIARPDVPRSRFIGSWTRKMTFDAGKLVPFLLDEILPGDHVTYDITAYLRMATPLFPLFDNQRVDTFIFFTPNRLVWNNWQKMMGEQEDPDSSIDYTVPVMRPTNEQTYPVGSIYDHFGLPTVGSYMVAGAYPFHSALPLRAYNLIYNEWFRDENLIASLTVRKGDTGDLETDYSIQRRAKSHDYFTSALPWAQKFTAPTVPLGSLAPVIGLGAANQTANFADANVYETDNAATVYYANAKNFNATDADEKVLMRMDGVTGLPMVYADLAAASGITINILRQAFMVQQLLERDARGGTRYTELLKAHFGVTSPDARLQRPEYIGGGQTPLNVTPIAQTAPTEGAPVGALGAAGTSAGSHRASYASTEHGYIIGLINVKSELSYQQGIHKMWLRETRYDFYWPALAGLGEQVIQTMEIWAGTTANTNVFGYQERWHEYRTRYSEVTGQFRSQASGSLDAWHLAQYFTTEPLLNDVFVEDNPPMARILAAGELADDQQYLANIMINRTITRPMPLYGTPVTLGRF